MQIREIRNPRLFQELVRALMLADRGATRYQVVDDSGGDGGLDGFDRQTGELHAIYCPEKPERAEVERRRYIDKFQGDMVKAVRLRDESGYDIRVFVFVTPSTLREPLQRQIRDEAKAAGFADGICVSGEALEVLFERHRYLLERFPELALPRIEPQLAAIRSTIDRIAGQQLSEVTQYAEVAAPVVGASTDERPYDRFLLSGIESPELAALEEALEQGDETVIARLPLIRAQTTDQRVLVAAALVEQGYWFHKHDISRAIAACEQGASVAKRLSMLAEEATLRALLARNLAVEASQIDLQHAANLVALATAGVPLSEPAPLAASLTRLRSLSTRIESEIREALRLVQGGGAYNLDALYWTYAMVGAIEAYMLTPRLLLANLGYGGDTEIASARARVLTAQEAAIRVSLPNGPAAQIRALENAANDLRLAGETRPALVFAQRALEIAGEAGRTAPTAEILVKALQHEQTEDQA
jgi:hypothetical protein